MKGVWPYMQELKVTLGGISSVVSTSASSAPQSTTSQKTSNSNALFGGGHKHKHCSCTQIPTYALATSPILPSWQYDVFQSGVDLHAAISVTFLYAFVHVSVAES